MAFLHILMAENTRIHAPQASILGALALLRNNACIVCGTSAEHLGRVWVLGLSRLWTHARHSSEINKAAHLLATLHDSLCPCRLSTSVRLLATALASPCHRPGYHRSDSRNSAQKYRIIQERALCCGVSPRLRSMAARDTSPKERVDGLTMHASGRTSRSRSL